MTIRQSSACLRFSLNAFRIQAVALLLLAAATATADEDSAGRFELTPFAGYGFGGDFEDVETGAELEFDEAGTFGVIFDITADATTQWEVLYLQQSTQLDTGALFVAEPILDVDVHYLHGGGTYVLDGDRVSFSLGAGLRFLPGKRIGLRLEGRWFGTFVDSDSEVFCQTGGSTNVCAVKVEGSLINQWHGFVGVTFRF
jgi:hypothetical protein